jgi:hypothetical protein
VHQVKTQIAQIQMVVLTQWHDSELLPQTILVELFVELYVLCKFELLPTWPVLVSGVPQDPEDLVNLVKLPFPHK